MRNTLFIGIMGISLFCGVIAKAEPITIRISGNVTGGYGSIWGSDVYVGAGFHGTYTYDSSAVNTGTYLEWGEYRQNSPYGINLSLGGFEFKTAPTHTEQFIVSIEDNSPYNPGDYYSIHSYENYSLSNDDTVERIEWFLDDRTETALSTIALPLTAPILNQWNLNQVFIYGLDNAGKGYSIQGMVTQADLVPEPLTGILMAIGVLFLRNRR